MKEQQKNLSWETFFKTFLGSALQRSQNHKGLGKTEGLSQVGEDRGMTTKRRVSVIDWTLERNEEIRKHGGIQQSLHSVKSIVLLLFS